jgi:3-oxoacyl-[acyl-carrier-protein] synthase-1
MCDAVICGGVDSLCRLTVNGFSALDSVSDETCQPFSRNRQGINIGEGACLFVMSHNPSGVQLSGVGETSDAHHISAPHPQGTGAIAAMQQALGDAQLTPEQVGYINLHGTATVQNDRMESLAVNEVFGSQVPCSSTKPLTGHTLGAAGAIEAGFCWLTFFADGRVPPQWWDGQRDDDIAELHLATVDGQHGAAPQHILSNSFAFGGNNIALILSANE